MLQHIRRILAAPEFPDAEKSRRARSLLGVAWSGIGILCFLIAVRLLQGISLLNHTTLILVLLVGIILVLIAGIHRGYVQQASLLLIVTSWSVMGYMAWTGAGLNDSAIVGQLVVVLICELLLGWQATVGLSVLSILSLWAMFFLESRGVLHPVMDDSFGIARDLTGAFLLSAALMYLLLINLRRSITELGQSEERFRKVFDSSPVAICIASLKEGRFLDANAAFWQLYGFEPKYALGKTATELGTWEGGPSERAVFVKELTQKRFIRNLDYVVTDQAGHKHSTLAFYELIELAGQVCVLAMFYDLTEKRLAEHALRESESRMRALLNAIPDMIFEFNEDGSFLNFIHAQEYQPLIPPEAFLGQNVRAILPEAVAVPTLSAIKNALTSGQTITFDYQLDGPAGLRDYEARLAASGPQSVLAIVRDITERKNTEAEREALINELELKNAELETFTYTVSHDLKAPLITIQGFLGLLREDAMQSKADRLNQDIQRISDATQKMQQLLNELLELSRIGRLMRPPESVPFETLVSDAVEMVQGRLDAQRVEVKVERPLPSVYVDRQRLVEVLQNLLDNAGKFMGSPVQPQIEIGQRGYQDGKPVFFVRDNGIGIDPQHHERIFGLFNKLDVQTEGTGVGLALVKRIIEVHGGRIWVESQLGEGATFFFTLPIRA